MHTNPALSDASTPLTTPEWVRVPVALRGSGWSRSYLYEKIASGEIRSACVRRKGAMRGIRLIHYPSLLEFIESFVGKEGD